MSDSPNNRPVGLVVRSAFADYSVNQLIIDEDTVNEILNSDHKHSVDKFFIEAYPEKEMPIKDALKKKGDK